MKIHPRSTAEHCGAALLFFVLLTFAMPPFLVAADTPDNLLSNGNFDKGLEGWTTYTGKIAEFDANSDQGVDGGPGLKVSLAMPAENEQRPNRWSVIIRQPIKEPIGRGDKAIITFQARSPNAASQRIAIGVKGNEDRSGHDYNILLQDDLGQSTQALTENWKEFTTEFRSPDGFGRNQWAVEFHLAAGHGQVELFLDNINVSIVPNEKVGEFLPYPWKGWEEDASWRQAAEERIMKYRRGALTVNVVDPDGNPIQGATIKAAMLRHEFPFGSEYSDGALFFWNQALMPEKEKYDEVFFSLFNSATPGNLLKWEQLSKRAEESNPEQALEILEFMRSKEMPVRGHTMIWPGWQNTPKWLRTAYTDKESPHYMDKKYLRNRIDEHFALLEKNFHNVSDPDRNFSNIYVWDVVNEPFHIRKIIDILSEDPKMAGGRKVGADIIGDWLDRAKSILPEHVKIAINDYSILTKHADGRVRQLEYHKALIEELLKNGKPLDLYGFQSHFLTTGLLQDIDRVYEIIDGFSTQFPSLEFEITEFDVDIGDEDMQAAYLRDFMTIAFSHPRIAGFTMWGFWDRSHWMKKSGMYRRDWTPKPSAEMYRKLVFGEWWTEEELLTDANGKAELVGFYGNYSLNVSAPGFENTQEEILFSKNNETDEITIRLTSAP